MQFPLSAMESCCTCRLLAISGPTGRRSWTAGLRLESIHSCERRRTNGKGCCPRARSLDPDSKRLQWVQVGVRGRGRGKGRGRLETHLRAPKRPLRTEREQKPPVLAPQADAGPIFRPRRGKGRPGPVILACAHLRGLSGPSRLVAHSFVDLPGSKRAVSRDRVTFAPTRVAGRRGSLRAAS